MCLSVHSDIIFLPLPSLLWPNCSLSFFVSSVKKILFPFPNTSLRFRFSSNLFLSPNTFHLFLLQGKGSKILLFLGLSPKSETPAPLIGTFRTQSVTFRQRSLFLRPKQVFILWGIYFLVAQMSTDLALKSLWRLETSRYISGQKHLPPAWHSMISDFGNRNVKLTLCLYTSDQHVHEYICSLFRLDVDGTSLSILGLGWFTAHYLLWRKQRAAGENE